jgi:predicted component of type VI protein secretion system
MPLTMRVVARGGDAQPPPIVASFDETGGLIGRADSARLVLPDPRRTVSRFHAHVSFGDGQYYIEDMGSPNPARLNGQPLVVGHKQLLAPGDLVQVGDYTLQVDAGDGRGRAESARRAAPLADDDAVSAPVATEELWQAFQEGLGVPVDLPQGLRPESMRLIGGLLAGSVDGLRRLLLLRAQIRREADIESAATIRPRNHNPLQQAPDTARALVALVRPPLQGFLAGPAAVEDAVDNLESHYIATMLALREAVEHTLARFDPAALEARLSAGGVLDAIVPGLRKARLWDLYRDQQRAIRSEAEKGFDEEFTRVFAVTYEQEAARLKARRGRG